MACADRGKLYNACVVFMSVVSSGIFVLDTIAEGFYAFLCLVFSRRQLYNQPIRGTSKTMTTEEQRRQSQTP